jgi:hypothetical protein
MPHKKCKTVYFFDELDKKAKEKAREWFREGNLDYDWYESVYEDANTIAKTLGFDLSVKGKEPCIWFSGFCNQGDGACFEGRYTASDTKPKEFYDHVGTTESNAPIIAIAENFFSFAKKHPLFTAGIEHNFRYYHERSVDYGCSESDETNDYLTDETEEEFKELCRSFMRWIYKQLEQEHDYLQSDEHVDESIKANEYEFTKEGGLA